MLQQPGDDTALDILANPQQEFAVLLDTDAGDARYSSAAALNSGGGDRGPAAGVGDEEELAGAVATSDGSRPGFGTPAGPKRPTPH